MPVERRCGKCWKILRPEEDFCSECGVFSVAEPLPIKINEDGTFEATVKFNSKHKSSGQGNEAIEYLRFYPPLNRKVHTVVEKFEENWKLVHDEDVIQEKKKKQKSEKVHDK